MTDATFLSKLHAELRICEKLAVVLSEASEANDDASAEAGRSFRAIADVGELLEGKLLDLRCWIPDDVAMSEGRSAAQEACESAHQAVREIESPIAQLEQQMILLDMAIETMMGSRSTESAVAGLSNLQGSMNQSIAAINRTWTEAHEATKALAEGAKTKTGKDDD